MRRHCAPTYSEEIFADPCGFKYGFPSLENWTAPKRRHSNAKSVTRASTCMTASCMHGGQFLTHTRAIGLPQVAQGLPMMEAFFLLTYVQV